MIENKRKLREAFGTFMSGVTVVTTLDETGAPLGFTANSFSSVSLDPPLLLVSIANSSSNYSNFVNAKGFAINILQEQQKEVSNTFSRPSDDRFGAVEWRLGSQGSPILLNVSAWFDCDVYKTVDAGDHCILIGQIKSFDFNQLAGLGYYRGSYFTQADSLSTIASGTKVIVSALFETKGQVLLFDDGKGGLVLPSIQIGDKGVQEALTGLINKFGVDAKPGFVFSVYQDEQTNTQHIALLCPSANRQSSLGSFFTLDNKILSKITNPALSEMLRRFANEHGKGNYGVYIGNQDSGEISFTNKIDSQFSISK